MAKELSAVTTPLRERRPFLWLKPVAIPSTLPENLTPGLDYLDELLAEGIHSVVRSFVNHTVAVQNERSRQAGRAQGVSHSVLNRRRRAVRAWLLAILGGKVDAGTLHTLTHSWLPQLAGTGPDPRRASRPARRFMEFLRGLITAEIFDRPAESLVPRAKALQSLETILGIHLQAMQEAADAEWARQRS